MTRKGYTSELKAKKELIDKYGKDSVVKVAIGGAQDFIIVGCGELLKVIEVKEVHNKNYYPDEKQKRQLDRIVEFSKHHNIPAELWIFRYDGAGKNAIKTTKMLYSPSVV